MRRMMIVLLAFLILTGCAAANVPQKEVTSQSSNQEQVSSEPAPIVSSEAQASDSKIEESETDTSNSMQTAADVPPEGSSSPSSNQEQVSSEPTPIVSSESQEPDDEVLELETDTSNSIEKPEARSEVQTATDTQSNDDAAYESSDRGSEPSSYQRWLEEIMKERKIKDFSKYSTAMGKIRAQIEDALDDTQYSSIDRLNTSSIDKETGEHFSQSIGLTINYVNLEKVQPVVEKYMEEYNSAEGIIDIEYKKCKYSLVELKKIKKEIESQPFNDVLYDHMIWGGQFHVTEMDGYDDLERFLVNKPYKDAVVIHEELDVLNPLT